MTDRDRRFAALGVFLGACFTAAFLGALATAGAVETWYPALTKPGWTPPGRLFGPVWTALYAAMAVAGWRVWLREGAGAATALFALQLLLNATWSFSFFRLRSPAAGLVNIVLLWAAILTTLLRFLRTDRLAGALFVPYLAWVTFAAALNFEIWRLNR